MSEGYNRVCLLGNLGADPELRVTAGGQAVLKLRMATTERFLNKAKEKQERTEWHRVTIFGNRAEALAKFLNKGDSLLVEGSIRTDTYEKDGEKRYSTEIVANNIVLTGGGSKRGGGEAAASGATARIAAPIVSDTDDNEIPF